MKLYLTSLGAPAPPVIALIGLFGILLGEQIPPLIKGYLREKPGGHSWLHHQVRPPMFGELPSGAPTLQAGRAKDGESQT